MKPSKYPQRYTEQIPDRLGESPVKQPRPGIPINRDDIARLLRYYHGNIARVADSLGTSRTCIRHRIDKDEELTSIKHETRERFIDTLEETAFNKALDGDTIMQLFLLKTIGRKRGYEQHEEKDLQTLAKAAFEFVLNRSKCPVEGLQDDSDTITITPPENIASKG